MKKDAVDGFLVVKPLVKSRGVPMNKSVVDCFSENGVLNLEDAMVCLAEDSIEQRRRNLADTMASCALEGIELDQEQRDVLELLVTNKISYDEAIARLSALVPVE